jgi:hypothetical protein
MVAANHRLVRANDLSDLSSGGAASPEKKQDEHAS